MIDYIRYEGHTEDWDNLFFTCGQGFFKTHGYHPCNDSDTALMADAPIILEALKTAEARIKELEGKCDNCNLYAS